jgi:hypothetical protein
MFWVEKRRREKGVGWGGGKKTLLKPKKKLDKKIFFLSPRYHPFFSLHKRGGGEKMRMVVESNKKR